MRTRAPARRRWKPGTTLEVDGERTGTALGRAVLRTQSDTRLVALTREGHDAAFEEIVRRYRPRLVRQAAAVVSADRAEDVVQESLTRALAALRSATPRSPSRRGWRRSSATAR